MMGLERKYVKKRFTLLQKIQTRQVEQVKQVMNLFYEIHYDSVIEWMFPLWVRFWVQYSLLLQYRILEKLVTYIPKQQHIHPAFQPTSSLFITNCYTLVFSVWYAEFLLKVSPTLAQSLRANAKLQHSNQLSRPLTKFNLHHDSPFCYEVSDMYMC